MRKSKVNIMAETERENIKEKANLVLRSDITMQFIFKIVIPVGIFILNFGLFLITVLDPSILRIVSISIFFILSIAFIINIKSYGGSH